MWKVSPNILPSILICFNRNACGTISNQSLLPFFVFELIFESLAVYISQYHIFPFQKSWYWKITYSQPLSHWVLGLWYQSFHQPWLFFSFCQHIFHNLPHFFHFKNSNITSSLPPSSPPLARAAALARPPAGPASVAGIVSFVMIDYSEYFYICFGFVTQT